ncbi:MAG: HAMP domain-containing sensor histidine kinase [Actinomycetota bacterium]
MSGDRLSVLGIAVACVLVVGAAGTVVLRRLRQRSLGLQMLVVPVVALVAVAVAVAVDAQVMFLSGHDSTVIALTLAAAMPFAALIAAWLGRDVSRSARRLAQTARALGRGEVVVTAPMASSELSSVAHELAVAGHDLAEARSREVAVETSRRELVAWVSHDLRTPLAGIRAMAEALEDGVVDDPDLYHKQLRIEADRLSGMVDTLFLLSRLHAGALRPVREPLALSDLVSDAVASIRPVAAARGVHLTGGADPDAVASVDASQLSRALANLLVNAVRHTPADGIVRVTARREADEVVLAVQDGCGGIPDTELPRVFDLAWRGERARTSGPDGGGGLGLAVTRGIVEAHDGTVGVVNVDGGCRFDVRLPTASPAARLPIASPAARPSTP